MKYRILFFLCFICKTLIAQVNPEDIWGSWVVSKVTYKDGTELPEENIIRSTYIKYTFLNPDKMFISGIYFENGSQVLFEINKNDLVLKAPEGSVINRIHIEYLGEDKLILQQSGRQGFDDPTALKYYFISEKALKKSIQISAKDVHSVYAGDTIYVESPKVYARFKGDGYSFQSFLTSHMGSGDLMHNKSGHIVASFIVSKSGIADSLKILESISPEYDKLYIKAFKKAKNEWDPAVLNGKYVSVQMLQEIRYSTSEMAIPSYNYTREANMEFNEKNYDQALYYYDQALANVPSDKENLYNRGICKKMLGNLAGACEDWNKVKELGGSQADALLEKYCR